MRIDTDEWIPLADITLHTSLIGSRTAYRLAESLGLIEVFFGVKCIRLSDVPIMEARRRRPGNQRWIESGEAAAAAAEQANERKRQRLAEQGPTKAEKIRNRKLKRAEWSKRSRKASST